ncbi:Uncharacterised protein [Vibrio cholerae]|nr:Uncharacterised protein [Vibrio cholerae]
MLYKGRTIGLKFRTILIWLVIDLAHKGSCCSGHQNISINELTPEVKGICQ